MHIRLRSLQIIVYIYYSSVGVRSTIYCITCNRQLLIHSHGRGMMLLAYLVLSLISVHSTLDFGP